MKFKHHKYTWIRRFETIYHRWELVCGEGGLHLSVSLFRDSEPGCGLEFHSVTQRGDDAPDHVDCPLTGGRCWHDGTSLYARETVWPEVESHLRRGDHDQIFKLLEYEATRHFGRADAT